MALFNFGPVKPTTPLDFLMYGLKPDTYVMGPAEWELLKGLGVDESLISKEASLRGSQPHPYFTSRRARQQWSRRRRQRLEAQRADVKILSGLRSGKT